MQGFPTSVSIIRTSVNAKFGATSLIATALSSMVVGLAILLLSPIIEHVPLASFAPIVIQAGRDLCCKSDFVNAWNGNAPEFVVMLITFVVSLALSIKEGLLVGFVLSLLVTIFGVANPNLAVLGKLPDGTFRDVRHFTEADVIPKTVIIRIDESLGFANARKFAEFLYRTVDVREKGGEAIRYVIVDGKAINNVDLAGAQMLESLAVVFQSREQCFIVANLKSHVSKALFQMRVPESIKSHGGHLCTEMGHALAIVSGVDPLGHEAGYQVTRLVQNVDVANHVIQPPGCAVVTTNMRFAALCTET